MTAAEFDLRVVAHGLKLLEKVGFAMPVLGMFLGLKEGMRKQLSEK